MGWKPITATHINRYDETVTLTIRDGETGATERIVSNRVHPFYVAHVETKPLVIQKLATIVSELARNIVSYAGGGHLAIRQCTSNRRCVHVEAKDQGPGIANLEEILAGKYKSRSGLGLGILGTKRLPDNFVIESAPGGTRVEVEVGY